MMKYSISALFVFLMLLGIVSCDESDDDDEISCYHSETSITGLPFGINLDPVRRAQLNTTWSAIFSDLDYLRNGQPLFIRVPLRAQWMQDGVTYDDQGNPTVIYDTDEGSYYAEVREIYNLAKAAGADIVILGMVYGTPDFNSMDGSHGPGIPIDVKIWENFVQTMLSEFPAIEHWEIWNEPDLDINWKGTASEFGELIYTPARNVIKWTNSGLTVVAPAWAQNRHSFGFLPFQDYDYPLFGWNGSTQDYDFGRGDLADLINSIGCSDAFDVWGVHGYANFASSDADWSSAIQTYVCEWDLWLQELGCPGNGEFELWLTEVGIDNKADAHSTEQARDFMHFFIEDQFLNYNDDFETQPLPGIPGEDPYITKMMVYELYDENPFNPQGTYMGLFYGVGSPKLVADKYREKITEFFSGS